MISRGIALALTAFVRAGAAIVETFNRLTESGDTRITESGDTRRVE